MTRARKAAQLPRIIKWRSVIPKRETRAAFAYVWLDDGRGMIVPAAVCPLRQRELMDECRARSALVRLASPRGEVVAISDEDFVEALFAIAETDDAPGRARMACSWVVALIHMPEAQAAVDAKIAEVDMLCDEGESELWRFLLGRGES